MAITTTTQVTLDVNNEWVGFFLNAAEYFTLYFEGTLPASLSSHRSTMTALWERYENIAPTTTPLAELTGTPQYPTRTGSQATRTPITKAVARYGDHLVLNEEVDLFQFNGQDEQLMRRLAEQAGRSVNMVQRNEMEDNSPQRFADGVANKASVVNSIQAKDLEAIIIDLNTARARSFTPMSNTDDTFNSTSILEAYIAVGHPHQANDIAKLSGFKSVETYNNHVTTYKGEYGFLPGAGYGLRCCQTSDASIEADAGGLAATNGLRTTGGTNADIYKLCVYGQEAHGSLSVDTTMPTSGGMAQDSQSAIQIINKAMGSAGTADPLNELKTLGWKAWSAAKVLDSTWCFSLVSGAKIPA